MKRNNTRNYQLLALVVVVALVASGCVKMDESGNPTGWVYEFLGRPAASFLDFLANMFGGNYGVAIIITTVITRIFMIPSTLKMTKTSMETQAKTKLAQPEIDAVREKINQAQTAQEKARLNEEMMNIYTKYDINMMASMGGCLPLLLQMPIISAVYTAIRVSPEIQDYTFLGIHLGETSLLLVIFVVLIYLLQGWMMQQQMPDPDPDNPIAAQTGKSMMLMNPIMIGWISYISAAGLALYFLVGGVFMLAQQFYVNTFVRPNVQAKIDQESAQYADLSNDIKVAKPVEPQEDRLIPTKEAVQSTDNRRRNEGKQNR